MGWFRSRSRWGSCLALFALALQLVLSFGHVHPEGGAPDYDHASAFSDMNAAAAATAADDDHAGKESPALADHACPICALIHLAGALVPAKAPALPRLAAFRRSPFEAAPRFDLATPHYSPLGARAPPLA